MVYITEKNIKTYATSGAFANVPPIVRISCKRGNLLCGGIINVQSINLK